MRRSAALMALPLLAGLGLLGPARADTMDQGFSADRLARIAPAMKREVRPASSRAPSR